jgi:hypothetical protein
MVSSGCPAHAASSRRLGLITWGRTGADSAWPAGAAGVENDAPRRRSRDTIRHRYRRTGRRHAARKDHQRVIRKGVERASARAHPSRRPPGRPC